MDVRLLNKYIAGDVLPEEKKEVIRWMRESEEHREQLMQLHRIYNATLWNGNVDSQDTKNAEKKKPVMRYPLDVDEDSRGGCHARFHYP